VKKWIELFIFVTINKLNMKKIMLIAFLLSLSSHAWAQDSESVMMTVQYMARFKSCVESVDVRQEEKTLEIGKTRSCFYGRWMRQRDILKDSLLRKGVGLAEVMGQIAKYPTPVEFYAVYTHYPAKGQLTYTDRLIKDFTYTETMETPQWKMLTGDSLILGYSCGKAACTFRGREWTAFYAYDLPLRNGPWKLCGLPGLILYAVDSTGDFSFEAIGLAKGKGQTLCEPKLKRMNKVTRLELKKLHQSKDKDPQKFAERFGLGGGGRDALGKPIVYKEKTTLFLENQ
jgi:GLPGLI family protein